MIKKKLLTLNLVSLLLLSLSGLNALTAQTEFTDFPWLTDVLNTTDCCQNKKVIAYELGIYTFIFIEKGEACQAMGGELYFQDGTFYCRDINDMDCRAAYGLTEENSTLLWDCEQANQSMGCQAFADFDLGPNPCVQCISELATYSYQGEEYFVVFGDNENCSDALTTVTNCDSTLTFCLDGGIAGFNQCADFFEEAVKLETKWSKKVDCTDNTKENCVPLEKWTLDENLCESCIGEVAIYENKGERYLVTIENNPICSDGLTTVTNCDSTKSFCLDGGIAGFNQCEDFFVTAVLVETLWSRAKDCNEGGKPQEAEPCTDLAGVDFGLCQAVMGVAVVDGKCTTVSGCLNYVVDGVDYTNAFFPTVEICQQTCGTSNSADLPEIFSEFPWLPDVIDFDNCSGTMVEFYDISTHFFIYIQTEERGAMYYQDGAFYCEDQENYDCRSLYGLTEKQLYETWFCVGEETGFKTNMPNFELQNQTNSEPILQAFPNPTNGLVQVALNTPLGEPQRIRVYDLYGSIVRQMIVEANNFQLDLSDQTAGIYWVSWENGSSREVVKVMKQN